MFERDHVAALVMAQLVNRISGYGKSLEKRLSEIAVLAYKAADAMEAASVTPDSDTDEDEA